MLWSHIGTILLTLLGPGATPALAADCKTATVGSPDSTCFDIYTRAKITEAQFLSFNPGLNCNTLQIGQKVCISSGSLPGPPGPQPNGTCTTYTTVANDNCAAIAAKFSITNATLLEDYNANTYKWKGCAGLQIGYTMCVSPGKPPPIPVNPNLQCGPESPGNKTCPLKACCSAFGFCGLTDEFCTTTGPNPCISNCGKPTLPSCAPNLTRKMGYYAGWGNRRTGCLSLNVAPNALDLHGYTHVLFAFAIITQDLKIVVSSDDAVLLKSLVDQKSKYNGLKVSIAVGGWDFSESDPTKDLFTVMISTSSNRTTFINSVKIFLSVNALDGIDIDFEYPGAMERNAPAEDTPNLTAFFKELRTALGSSVIISIATPAGYWFLRGFEIDKIASSVTFINMMSYDYHGQWDTNITGQPSVTNPHTSIKDMQDSVLLYTKAGIDMRQVNLGLAWYARTYHLVNPQCSGYNCSMNSGGAAGKCSLASGYLTQFEVLDLMSQGNSARFDQATQTYWFDDQAGDLVTFDQADTWQSKTNFAGSTCFGGTFVWSLDQLGPNGGVIDVPKPDPTYSVITWNPNPYPSPGAPSETFVQSAGTFTTVGITTVTTATQTFTRTVTVSASTETIIGSTVSSGTTIRTTKTTVHPSSVVSTRRTQPLVTTRTTTVIVTATRTTVVIPVPTTTTTLTIQTAVITIGPGGTPLNAPLPTYISEVSAITPNWTFVILPPPGASDITFTAPLTSSVTWSTTVKIPTSSSTSSRVDGPPGDHNICNSNNFFFILLRGLINPCNPPDVGIINGITPKPIKPPEWTGPWTNPFPLPTGPPGDTPDQPTSSSSSSSSSTSSSACTGPTASYNIPSEDPNWADHGTDPDRLRRRAANINISSDPLLEIQITEHSAPLTSLTSQNLQKRADPRRIQVQGCGPNARVDSPAAVLLNGGRYYSVPRHRYTDTSLSQQTVGGRPGTDTAQEHVFELGYFGQFFANPPMNSADCNWIITNVFNARSFGGNTIAQAILAAIDNTNNMVWVDTPMNQAKSNIVNQNTGTPQGVAIDVIGDFTQDEELIYDIEYYLRNFAALGSYFRQTGDIFRNTARSVQLILAQITPDRVLDPGQSIPDMFDEWLEALLETYPSQTVDRANTAWAAYRRQMGTVSVTTARPVPQCFALYNGGIYNPATFSYQPLLPPQATLPKCNVPGVQGSVGYWSLSGGATAVRLSPQFRVMGSGRLDSYGIGSGTSFAVGTHWKGSDLSSQFAGCGGSYLLSETAANGSPDVLISFDCSTLTGKLNAPILFSINNAGAKCLVAQLTTTSSQRFDFICGPQGSVATCAQNYGVTGTSKTIIDQQWIFFPS